MPLQVNQHRRGLHPGLQRLAQNRRSTSLTLGMVGLGDNLQKRLGLIRIQSEGKFSSMDAHPVALGISFKIHWQRCRRSA